MATDENSVFQSAKKTYGGNFNQPISKSLVSFDGTKLRLSENLVLPDPAVKVVSILGKARMGKSSFLNTFISKYVKGNNSVFTTADGIEHCTYGVDYCYIPEQKLLLLDSQGLANGDARHDPALLLFIYLVSNVVIFNDSKILQNEALKLIEPICTFTQYLDMESFVKPVLMFRLSDGKLVKDVQKNLDNVMAHHEDQYNSIRESIENVFQDPVRIVKTETLKENDEHCLLNSDYLGLLSNSENGFDSAISTIMEIVSHTEPRTNILSSLTSIIEKINSNEQIKIEKLDVVALVHENAIREWLDAVPDSLKTDLAVDGTQAAYDSLVVPRKALVTKYKTDFTKKFKAISDTIKKKHKATLDSWLDGPLKKATALSEELAVGLAKKAGLLSLESDSQLSLVKDVYLSFAENEETLVERYLGVYKRFRVACAGLYKPIREFYDKWVESINSSMASSIKEAREGAEQQKALVSDYINTLLAGFDDWTLSEIEKLDIEHCCIQNKIIVEKWRQEKRVDLHTFIKRTVKKQNIQLSIKKSALDAKWEEDQTEISGEYPLIAELVKEFNLEISNKPLAFLIETLIEKKETLLMGKIFKEPAKGKLFCSNNPEIKFVFDLVLLNTFIEDHDSCISFGGTPYMTKRTWETDYRKYYTMAEAELKLDGLLHNKHSFEDFVLYTETNNVTKVYIESKQDMYYTNISAIFRLLLQKIYCRQSVFTIAESEPDKITLVITGQS